MRSGRRRARRLLVACAALWLCGCGDRRPPDVVVITIDTLRADRLGCYGSRTTRTPNIDGLAGESVLFENVATTMPETRPAHASLFTGRYPRQHGVLSNAMTLDAAAVTLAERFGDAGYDTAAFVGCVLLDERSGVAQGFARIDAPRDPPTRPADRVVATAKEWLERTDPQRPLFLWVHLFDPHMPYEPPAEIVRRRDARGVARAGGLSWPLLFDAAEQNGGDLPPRLLARGLRLYDAEVELADREVGQLFAALRDSGRYDDSVIALTADHGECFDHGIYFEHSGCLYDGALRIPLLLRAPGSESGAAARRTDQAEILDLAPTLLALAGLAPENGLPGRDLLGGERSPRPAFAQHPLYREYDVVERRKRNERLRSVAGDPTRPVLGDRELVGVRTPDWKLLVERDAEELYHLAADPEESTNLAIAEPERASALRDEVRRWLRAHPVRLTSEAPISDELRRELQALGYL